MTQPPETAGTAPPSPSLPASADAATLFKFAEFEHRYVCQQIALADSKASAVFAGASFVLALAVQSFGGAVLAAPLAASSIIVMLGLFGLGMAALMAFLVLLPREGKIGNDPIYFNDVAGRESFGQYWRDVQDVCDTPVKASEIMLANSFGLAAVCRAKFRLIRVALLALALGVALLSLRMAL